MKIKFVNEIPQWIISSDVAAWEEKFSFVGIEINETYYNNAVKHFKQQSAQTRLF
jgi:DNA modification methylase